jgi:hypothetical protein
MPSYGLCLILELLSQFGVDALELETLCTTSLWSFRCTFPASYDKLFRVGFPDTLPSYLGTLENRITRFDLPLGANVCMRPNQKIVLEVCVPALYFSSIQLTANDSFSFSKFLSSITEPVKEGAI